jgi:signal peptidase I
MFTLLILVFLLALSFLSSAAILKISARWFGAARPTFGRAVIATLGIAGIGIALATAVFWLESRLSPDFMLPIVLGALLVQVLLIIVCVRVTLKMTFLRAAAAWLVSLAAGVFWVAVVLFVLRPFVVEAFVVSANSMAPTLLGWHTTGTCPRCGQVAFVSAQAPGSEFERFAPPDRIGICSQCGEMAQLESVSSAVDSPDRFFSNKLIKPRRWDLVVYRYPKDPSMKYVSRLVGLPGEVVFIKDGALWVNDTKLEPPADVGAVRYVTELEAGHGVPTGSPEKPWNLQAGECVVLGDFGLRASDSRFWGPVPEKNIEAVATIRYWPPSRWHVWR